MVRRHASSAQAVVFTDSASNYYNLILNECYCLDYVFVKHAQGFNWLAFVHMEESLVSWLLSRLLIKTSHPMDLMAHVFGWHEK